MEHWADEPFTQAMQIKRDIVKNKCFQASLKAEFIYLVLFSFTVLLFTFQRTNCGLAFNLIGANVGLFFIKQASKQHRIDNLLLFVYYCHFPFWLFKKH